MVPFRESYFGSSNHPIVLNRVHCNGNEDNLTECDSVKLTGYCSHSDEAGVACLSSSKSIHLYIYTCVCVCVCVCVQLSVVYVIVILFSLY